MELVCEQATARQGHRRKKPSVAVRSFLRFLVFGGEVTPVWSPQHPLHRSSSRQTFLHCLPSFQPLAISGAIVKVVRLALQRAGVAKQPRVMSHIFRHYVAFQMLNQGANFKEVADILGLLSLQTVRYSEHGASPKVLVKGRNLDSLEFEVSGYCDTSIEQAKEN